MAVAASLASSSSSSRTSIASSALARTSIHEGLKTTNPDAYAIVQALITKKSLGLLNPRHPNAFGGYQDAPGKGTMSTDIVDPQPAVPVAAVATQTQHSSNQNFFNWKPHEDDDSLVSNVLGAVSSLKNGASAS